MSKRAPQPRNERQATDDTLGAERSKTDDELERALAGVEAQADDVVEVARERAEATLRTARARTDRESDSTPTESRLRKAERATEDRVVAEERVVADDQLQEERDDRQRALSALFRLEREATDERLVNERTRADEELATRDDFLAIVSHDLRTLLGGIAVSASLLANDAAAAGPRGTHTLAHAQRIQRSTARTNRLVGDLLDVVSLEAGKLDVTPRANDVTLLVRDTVEAFQESFASKGLELTADLPGRPVLAEFDHERTLQVLGNLVSNALKFTQAGGQVILRVTANATEVRLSVADNGPGVPEDRLEHIFERFQQGRRKDRRGLGLGLYIAKSIVEAQGGRLWVESHASGGSAFHFTLRCMDG